MPITLYKIKSTEYSFYEFSEMRKTVKVLLNNLFLLANKDMDFFLFRIKLKEAHLSKVHDQKDRLKIKFILLFSQLKLMNHHVSNVG